MGKAHRLFGYLASFVSASLFYVVCFSVQICVIERQTIFESHSFVLSDSRFIIGFALLFWLFEGKCAALLLLALPWRLAVAWYDRSQRLGIVYFSLIGAVTTLILGCVTSSLAPKLLFIEDQTFWEGFVIALWRQGLCLLLTGFVFGLTFWYVSGKRQHSRSIKVATVQSDSPLE